MKTTLFLSKVVVACVVILLAKEASAAMPRGLCRSQTLQNLADVKGAFFAQYLAIDPATGEVKLNPNAGEDAAESHWEMNPVSRRRGCKTTLIQSRGDSPFNGWYLGIDGETGALVLTERAEETSEWVIKYAGRHMGFPAFYVQNLARTTGGFDMHYLGIDETTGDVVLRSKPDAGTNWSLRPSPDLPTEF